MAEQNNSSNSGLVFRACTCTSQRKNTVLCNKSLALGTQLLLFLLAPFSFNQYLLGFVRLYGQILMPVLDSYQSTMVIKQNEVCLSGSHAINGRFWDLNLSHFTALQTDWLPLATLLAEKFAHYRSSRSSFSSRLSQKVPKMHFPPSLLLYLTL